MNGILQPDFFKCMEKDLEVTSPRYSEPICLVPWHFVKSRFHCNLVMMTIMTMMTMMTMMTTMMMMMMIMMTMMITITMIMMMMMMILIIMTMMMFVDADSCLSDVFILTGTKACRNKGRSLSLPEQFFPGESGPLINSERRETVDVPKNRTLRSYNSSII